MLLNIFSREHAWTCLSQYVAETENDAETWPDPTLSTWLPACNAFWSMEAEKGLSDAVLSDFEDDEDKMKLDLFSS